MIPSWFAQANGTGGYIARIHQQGRERYDGHRNIRIDLLADDFLSTSGKTTIALKSDPAKGKAHEGAALILYKGKYIAAGSGVEGWNPTDTSDAIADAPLGPYREMGRMSEQRTWCQSQSVLGVLAGLCAACFWRGMCGGIGPKSLGFGQPDK